MLNVKIFNYDDVFRKELSSFLHHSHVNFVENILKVVGNLSCSGVMCRDAHEKHLESIILCDTIML